MTILKPVSDLERKFLAKLGESPAQHQAQVLIKQTVRERNSTSKLENVHYANREVEKRLLHTEPSSEIAARLEAKESQKEADAIARARAVEWVPDAYVLFIRHSRCLSCGHTDRCLDHASLFIRLHPKFNKDDSSGRMYVPTKVLPPTPLPRLMESRVVTLPTCEACFDKAKAKPQCPAEPSLQVDTVTTTDIPLPSTSPQKSESCTLTVSDGSFFLEQTPGQESGRSSPSLSATVTESSSGPTDAEQEAASGNEEVAA